MRRLILLRPGLTDGPSYQSPLNEEGNQQANALINNALRPIIGSGTIAVICSGAPCTSQMAALIWVSFPEEQKEQGNLMTFEAFFPADKGMEILIEGILRELKRFDADLNISVIVLGHHDYFPNLLEHYFPNDLPGNVVMPNKAEGWCIDFTDPKNPYWSLVSAER